MHYPNTKEEIRLGDPVWLNEGKWLTRVIRVIETEAERREANVEENGFYFSYEASEKTEGLYGFMPYRLMKDDLCYRATEEELFGIRLILHRLFMRYQIDRDELMYSISARWPTHDESDGLRWKIGVTEAVGRRRRFIYKEETDEFCELPMGDSSLMDTFSWVIT